MTKKDEKESEKVDEPGELDVLCGRGGMSNHHSGNEWYRRLIKSNRPLYRACPKHTKLLVSKAIVQAVEQQGGRFLERNRNDGCWNVCTYKRAVDKTSQGLRERDREDDSHGGGSVGTDELPADLGSGQGTNYRDNPVELPDAFSGKNQLAPKLSDLADAALDQARKMDGLPRSASQLVGFGSASQGKHSDTSEPKPKSLSPKKRPAPSLKDPPPEQQHQETQHSKRMKELTAKNYKVEEEDFVPLPPSLEPRESSMFRLLKQTKLLLQESETWGKGTDAPANSSPSSRQKGVNNEGENNEPKKGNSMAERQQKQNDIAIQKMHIQQVMLQAHGHQPPDNYNLDTSSTLDTHITATSGDNNVGGRENEQVPPALTQLTTQMSDWLTSFWPVSSRGQSVIGAPGRQPPGVNTFGGITLVPPGAPSEREMARHAFQKNVASKIVNVPPPHYAPMQIRQIPPMKQQNDPENRRTTVTALPAKRSKRKSPSMLPELPDEPGQCDNGKGEQSRSMDGIGADAIPTELEQSVSATLLKLAGTPSKLFVGLSSFFLRSADEGQRGGGRGPPGMGNVAENAPALPLAGTRRTGGSLLGDYDETPIEHRMRVGVRRNSRSLLDDDDETPFIEQRMRAPFVRH